MLSEYLDQYFDNSNLNKTQEQIEEIKEEQEETIKEEREEEETENEEVFEEKEEPTFINASEYAEKIDKEQIEKEKEEVKEEEKEEKHHYCKEAIDKNSDDIYNLFKVVIPHGDAVNFAKIINALSFCLDEAYIYFQEDKGLFIRNMDPSHVVLGLLHIPYENLQEYETISKYEHAKNQIFENYNLPNSSIFQVDLSSLKPLLSRARKDDALTLTLNNPQKKEENEVEKSYIYSELELTLEGGRGAKKEFSLTARSIDGMEGLTDLTLEHDAKIEFVAAGLNEAVKDIAIIKPEFVFLETNGIHSDEQVFIMKAEEDEGYYYDEKRKKARIQFEKHNETLLNDTICKEAKTLYNFEMIQKIFKASPLADKIEIGFSSDMPLQVTFNLTAQPTKKGRKTYGGHNIGTLTYYLAPRIEK